MNQVLTQLLLFAGRKFSGLVLGSAMGFVNVIKGGLTAVMSLPLAMFSRGLAEVQKFDEMGVKSARNIGMSYGSSVAYTGALIKRTKDLAAVYGVTSEAIGRIQENLTKATGKAILFADSQAEIAVAAEKVIGEGAVSEFQTQFQSLGGTIEGALNSAIDSYTTATQMGLAAQEHASKVAQNLKMANSYKFAEGVDGIRRMTALSQKLGFNFQSISGVIDKFNSIQGSIESSANLQMLGGMGAVYGSNPMTMLYESLNDPEALTERMTKIFGSMAIFNTKTGMGELSGYGMAMIKEQAKAMGMNPEEAVSIAKNSAKVDFINKHMGSAMGNLTDEQKAFVQNKAQYDTKSGEFVITDTSGKSRNISEMTAEDVIALQKQESMSDREAFMNGAQQIVSVSERIEGIQAMIGAQLAETLYPMLDGFKSLLQNIIPNIAKLVSSGISMSISLLKIIVAGVRVLANTRFWTGLAKYTIQGVAAGFSMVAMAATGLIIPALVAIKGAIGSLFSFFSGDKSNKKDDSNFLEDILGISTAKSVFAKVGEMMDNFGIKGWDSNDKEGRELRNDWGEIKSGGASLYKEAKSAVKEIVHIGGEVVKLGSDTVNQMAKTGEDKKDSFNKAISAAKDKEQRGDNRVYKNNFNGDATNNKTPYRGLGTYGDTQNTSNISTVGAVSNSAFKNTYITKSDVNSTVVKNIDKDEISTQIEAKPVGNETYFADGRKIQSGVISQNNKMEFSELKVSVNGNINVKGSDGQVNRVEMASISKEIEKNLVASIRSDMNKHANMGMINRNVSYDRGVGIDSGHRTA